MTEELRMVFEGRVQGVGFRATVCDIAAELKVTGWVANARDGTVHMCAQGESAELQLLKQQILRVRARNIVNSHENWRKCASGESEFTSFSIRSQP